MSYYSAALKSFFTKHLTAPVIHMSIIVKLFKIKIELKVFNITKRRVLTELPEYFRVQISFVIET